VLKFWELAPSPNNTKVRMALRFKGIEFETIVVDPFDRAPVAEVSGQELTPVIADRGIVLNDSEAILQYLDANYRDTPRLFPTDRAGRREADDWKRELDRRVASAWLPVFLAAIGRRESFEPAERQAFEDALRGLQEELGDRDSFKGPEMPICDLRVAQWATYAFPGPGLLARAPFFERLKKAYGIAEGSLPRLERFLAPWNERLA
jgi:glutathione S-transferase